MSEKYSDPGEPIRDQPDDFTTYRADVEPVLRAAVDYEACEEFEVSDKQMALSDAIAASRVCQRIAREGK